MWGYFEGMKYDYNELLKSAREQIPKEILEHKRFEIPKVKGMVQGNKTIVMNLNQIANYLNRDVNHVLKFFSLELATFGQLEETRAVFVGKFSSDLLNSKLKKYANEFVFCPSCKKPDTKLVKKNRISFIKCMACGSRNPIKSIK